MKRCLWVLVFGLLTAVALPAVAGDRHGSHYGRGHGGYGHHGYGGGVYYRPAPRPLYYYPAPYVPTVVYPAPGYLVPQPGYLPPAGYLQYRARGLSIGVGF